MVQFPLGDGLGRDRLAEAGEATGDVDRDSATDRRIAPAQGGGRLAPGGEAQVLDPVELQRGGEVVDLRQADVPGIDASLLVGWLMSRGSSGPPKVYSSTEASNRLPSHSSHVLSTVAMKPRSVEMTPAPLHTGQAPSELALNRAGLTPFALAKALRIGSRRLV